MLCVAAQAVALNNSTSGWSWCSFLLRPPHMGALIESQLQLLLLASCSCVCCLIPEQQQQQVGPGNLSILCLPCLADLGAAHLHLSPVATVGATLLLNSSR